jgi:hypothetical protein
MDIHKPKPWRSLREFLKEYAIIVVGVLTALGGEQLVETLHWKHRVAETRAQLEQELGGDADSSLAWLTNAPCLDAQLAALKAAIADARRTGVFHAPKQPYAPTLTVFKSDAWLNARSLQVSDHMSAKEVKLYATAFFFPTELSGNITTLHNLAGELEPLSQDLERVSPAEAGEWAARIGRVQELQSRTALAMTLTIYWAQKLHAPISLQAARDFAAEQRHVEGACVADPATVLAASLDHSIDERARFAKLGLTPMAGM